MPGYLPALADAGNTGQKYINFNLGHIRVSLDDLTDWLPGHGWDFEGEGSNANTFLFAFGLPAGLGVPGGSGFIPFKDLGVFFGYLYRLWNPIAGGAVDPTGTFTGSGIPIVGVELGNTHAETAENFRTTFNGFQDDYTLGEWVHASPSESTATLTADEPGPLWNVDSSGGPGAPFSWGPNGANMFGPQPRGGGWYFNSTPNPRTGDVIRLHAYEDQENAYFRTRFNATAAWDSQVYQMKQMTYLVTACPYQFAMIKKEGEIPQLGDGAALTDFICSALYVPDDFAQLLRSVASCTNVVAVDAVITTTQPHYLNPGARVVVAGIAGGPSNINGKRFVKAVVSPTKLTVSILRWGIPIKGDGAGAGAGGSLISGIEHSMLSVADWFRSSHANNFVSVLLNDEFHRAPYTNVVGHNQVIGVDLPMINCGTQGSPLKTSARKPIIQAPMVSMCTRNDVEGRMGGQLWNTILELQDWPRYHTSLYLDRAFMVWGREDGGGGAALDWSLYVELTETP